MPAIAKQRVATNAAAQELWRVAEAGDVDELGQIFSRGVDVDARNKHGMTALMRAAYHGHGPMVRALLERGANPNLARNDKFTALALAAFFGHTESVTILIEHGAKTEVITRCGASAQMWATARTFEDAARCLQSHSPAPTRSAPVPARAPVPAPAPSAPLVIKTLKEPPEIWDLVHEVPRNFNPRSAFFSRLKSMKTSLAFRIAAGIVVSAACVIGVLVLKGSEAHNLPAQPPASQSVVASEVSAPAKSENTNTESTVAETPEVAEFSHHSAAPVGNDTRSRKVKLLTRQTRVRSTPVEEPVPAVKSNEVPAAPAPASSPRVETRNAGKANAALSPQLIAPAKNAPPKGKVIQWP